MNKYVWVNIYNDGLTGPSFNTKQVAEMARSQNGRTIRHRLTENGLFADPEPEYKLPPTQYYAWFNKRTYEFDCIKSFEANANNGWDLHFVSFPLKITMDNSPNQEGQASTMQIITVWYKNEEYHVTAHDLLQPIKSDEDIVALKKELKNQFNATIIKIVVIEGKFVSEH